MLVLDAAPLWMIPPAVFGAVRLLPILEALLDLRFDKMRGDASFARLPFINRGDGMARLNHSCFRYSMSAHLSSSDNLVPQTWPQLLLPSFILSQDAAVYV